MNLDQRFDWKIQKLERAYEQSPRDPVRALRLAEAYFQKGYYLGAGDEWFDRAIERVSEALDAGLVTSSSCTLLANALYGREELEAAGEAYEQALILDSKNALAHVGIGNLEKRRGDFQKARERYQAAVEIAPDLWQAHYNLGGAYYQEARAKGLIDCEHLLERAIFHLVRALKLNPFENFIDNIHKDLGELLLHTGEYRHARKFFTRLLKNERYRTIAHYYLGLTNHALGKYNLAIQNYRNFLKHEPDNAPAYSRIGLARLELKDYERAREACAKALEIDGDNLLARFTIGCSYLDENVLDKAIETFEHILELNPDYFPAYVELVRAHFSRRNYPWLFEQLGKEIDAFEQADGYDGGRGYYKGKRGGHRRRMDVLLAQIRELGPRSFPHLLEALHAVRTDSLRFQLWEEIYHMSRRVKVDLISRQLAEPELHLSRRLGHAVVLLSRHLPEELLMEAFHTNEDRIKRAALQRVRVRNDVGAYMEELETARADYQELQGYLLRAMAVKGTREVERFLIDALDRPERALRLSAAVALVYYGNERALELLEHECGALDEPERAKIEDLVRIGRLRQAERSKIIHLTDAQRRAHPPEHRLGTAGREVPPAPAVCTLCGRGQREVERMLAGSRLMICISCVRELKRDKTLIRADQHADVYCSFCHKSIYEVDAFYSRHNLYMCNLCIDLCMGVLEKEEVGRFLNDLK